MDALPANGLMIAGKSNLDIALRIAGDPCPRATSVAPDLPPEIDELFARALAPDREDRFQSAREIGAAITAITARLRLLPEPPSSSRISFEPASGSAPESLRFATDGSSPPPPSLYRPTFPGADPAPLRALPGGGGARGDETFVEGSPLSSRAPGQVRRSGTIPRATAPRAVSTLIDEGFDALRVGDREGAERCWRAALELELDNRLLQLDLQKLAALGGKSLLVGER